jgi:biopolymer transport protein ExbB
MPTSLVLSWLTARMQRERVFANRAFRVVFAPQQAQVSQQTQSGLSAENQGAPTQDPTQDPLQGALAHAG